MINANIISVLMGGGASEHPTLKFLKENARALWTMEDGIDKTGNGYDLVGDTGVFTGGSVQVPNYKTFQSFDGRTTPVAYCTSGNIPLLPAGHATLLQGDHEFHFMTNSSYYFSTQYLFGVSVGVNLYFLNVTNDGKLTFTIRSRVNFTTSVTTVDPHWTGVGSDDRRNIAQKYIRLRIDYTLNTIEMWINGGKVALTSPSDSVVNWDPTYFSGANPFAIGSANVNNTTSNFQSTFFRNVGFCAVTDLLTSIEADAVTDYVMNRQGTDMKVSSPDNPVFSTKSRITLGVKMSTPPVGTVDVTISGTYITTINKTLTVQECTDGYAFSFFANDATHGFEPFDITVAAVGYNPVIIPAYISEDTKDINSQWTPMLNVLDGVTNWRYELPTFTDATAKRTALANDIFRDTSGGYPSGAPYAILTGQSTVNGITLNNANSSTKVSLEFRENDPDGYYWSSVIGWSQNSTPSTVLVIDHLGHGEPGHDLMYNAIINAGYDYANCALPYTTNNPLITASFLTDRHNEILTGGIDRIGYDARRLFIFDKIRGLDYILSQKTYTKIIFTGISGGGQMGILLGALDTRYDKVFSYRGTGAQAQPYGKGDYEQGSLRLFDNLEDDIYGTPSPRVAESLRNISRLDMMALCGAGGREFHWLNHLTDDCCWKGYYPDIVKRQIEAKTTALGGSFFQHSFTDPATAHHGYYASDDIAYLLSNI